MPRTRSLTQLGGEPVMTVGEVADLFGVDSRTVARWDREHRLPESFRTLGGHRRWYAKQIHALLADQPAAEPAAEPASQDGPAQ